MCDHVRFEHYKHREIKKHEKRWKCFNVKTGKYLGDIYWDGEKLTFLQMENEILEDIIKFMNTTNR